MTDFTTHECPTCGNVHLPPNDEPAQGEGPQKPPYGEGHGLFQ